MWQPNKKTKHMKWHFILKETYEKRHNHNNNEMQIKTTESMSHPPVWQLKIFFYQVVQGELIQDW